MKNRLTNNYKKKQKQSDQGFLRYTTIAYQLIAIIAVGFLAGYFLDRFTGWTFPVFKIILSFGSVIAALYIIVKKLLNEK